MHTTMSGPRFGFSQRRCDDRGDVTIMRNPRHMRTVHVQANPRACEACGRCVEACRNEALGLVRVLFHSHVHVDHPERCRGCLRCVRACPQGAIQPLHPRPPRDGVAGATGGVPGGEPAD